MKSFKSILSIERYRLYRIKNNELYIIEMSGEAARQWIDAQDDIHPSSPFMLYGWIYNDWQRTAWCYESNKIEKALETMKIVYINKYNQTN